MNVQITHKNWILPEGDRDVIERRIDRLAKKLPHMPGDMVHLVVCVDKHGGRSDFVCSARLTVFGEVLAVRGKYDIVPRTAISEVFDDVERQLDKFLSSRHVHA
jgi:ribosome-associated translation inhibitor RaiA